MKFLFWLGFTVYISSLLPTILIILCLVLSGDRKKISGKLYWQEKWSLFSQTIEYWPQLWLWLTSKAQNTHTHMYYVILLPDPGSSSCSCTITKGHRPLMIYHSTVCACACPGTIVVEQQQLITKRTKSMKRKEGGKLKSSSTTVPKSSSAAATVTVVTLY